MIACPIQDTAKFNLNWIRIKPRVSQWFGGNEATYSQFGMKGHNGIDLAVPTNTPVFAPIAGIIKIKDCLGEGYGLHVRIYNTTSCCEIVLGHLSGVLVKDGDFVSCFQKIALSGNSGFSTGPHLHMGLRFLIPDMTEDIRNWKIKDYKNGYFGYVDFNTVCWKGDLVFNSLT
jgi:murein DD-endopeptidase MepM/ murein hydrolase activator NlpD